MIVSNLASMHGLPGMRIGNRGYICLTGNDSSRARYHYLTELAPELLGTINLYDLLFWFENSDSSNMATWPVNMAEMLELIRRWNDHAGSKARAIYNTRPPMAWDELIRRASQARAFTDIWQCSRRHNLVEWEAEHGYCLRCKKMTKVRHRVRERNIRNGSYDLCIYGGPKDLANATLQTAISEKPFPVPDWLLTEPSPEHRSTTWRYT